MKKRWITCIVFLSLGTVLALAGAIGMKFDFSYYKRGELQTFDAQLSKEEYQDKVQSLKIINYYGELNLSTSDSASSLSLSYTAYEENDVKFTISSNGLLSISKGRLLSMPNPWYNPFGYFEKKGTLDIVIPTSWTITDLSLDIRKGTITAQNLTIDNQKIELYSGKVQMDTLKGNRLEIKTYAGTVSIQNATFDELTKIKQSSGKVTMNQLFTKKLSFQASLSQLNVSLASAKEEYAIQVKKNFLSSINVKNTEVNQELYQIEGKMNLSSAKITFLNEVK
ncbi:unknown [Coprobacillus sp. CAG:826]|mgnify:FL=1|nr:DUF4097 family beta strand repeat protein [Coprobacillus sp.]CDD91580.1 unknown [Coprobacillus sp. CAG:826]